MFLLIQSLKEHFTTSLSSSFRATFTAVNPSKNTAMNVITPYYFLNLAPDNVILKDTEESASGHMCYREVSPRFMWLALLHQISYQEVTVCLYLCLHSGKAALLSARNERLINSTGFHQHWKRKGFNCK